MNALWLFVITFAGHEPVIDSQWPSQAKCEENLPLALDTDESWVSGCIAIRRDDWPKLRAHR